MRRHRGRLEEDAVSGSQGACQRREHELHGKVPGTDDERRAVGLGDQAAFTRKVQQRRTDPLRFCPRFEAPERMLDHVDHDRRIAPVGLEVVPVQVLLQRGEDRRFIVDDRFSQYLELFYAKCKVLGPARGKECAVVFYRFGDLQSVHK